MAAWTDNLALKLVNILTYVFLFGSNTYSSVEGIAGHKETYITPASYTFYVWTLINFLLLGYVILQFFEAGYSPIINHIGYRFPGVALLNAIFVWFFSNGHYILAFITSVFLALVISHVYYDLKNISSNAITTKLFVHLPFSLWHAFSVLLLFISGFAAFGKSTTKHAGIFTDVFVCIALAFLSSTSIGYAFNGAQGDVAGAAVICFGLFGVFSEHRHPALIHWFALGAAIVSAFSVIKALATQFRKDSSVIADDERAPLVGN